MAKINSNFICPYCGKEIRKAPRKKKRCPDCKEFIYTKANPYTLKKYIVSDEEAKYIEKSGKVYSAKISKLESYLTEEDKYLSLKKYYEEWRWRIYHDIDLTQLSLTLNYPKLGKSLNIPKSIIKQYKHKDFQVSQKKISEFDKKQFDRNLEKIKNSELRPNNHNLRSAFIENCFIYPPEYSKDELLQKIENNLIYYHWWDQLTFEELIKTLVNLHFLKSTKKLIPKEEIYGFFQTNYSNKKELIDKIFYHFTPEERMINRMNELNDPIFDYNWLFGNSLQRAIRIIENECRLFNDEQIIGAFYNEDILFREIQKNFGNDFKIVSQGSPEWLKPQRFDIYLPELNIAVEYQGEQHYFPVDFGGKGEKFAKKQFEENIKRDKKKKELAEKNNCPIIYVYPDYKMDNIISDLEDIIIQKQQE